jgi:sulfonate dioxygenase
VTKLIPRAGTEITGLQLSEPTPALEDEFALLVAEQGVVVFRDQDQRHWSRCPKGSRSTFRSPSHPTCWRVHQRLYRISLDLSGQGQLVSPWPQRCEADYDGYHSGVSYEYQPLGITLLTLLQVPETGGDTAWTSQAAAYDRLSQPLKVFLKGLKAEHSGFPQADNARRDGRFVRREPVKSYHPIVRVHPVTGQKVLSVNPGLTKSIVGLKTEESDAILKLLFTVSNLALHMS